MIESNKNEKDNDIELTSGLNIALSTSGLQYIESEDPVKKQKRKCMKELIYVPVEIIRI